MKLKNQQVQNIFQDKAETKQLVSLDEMNADFTAANKTFLTAVAKDIGLKEPEDVTELLYKNIKSIVDKRAVFDDGKLYLSLEDAADIATGIYQKYVVDVINETDAADLALLNPIWKQAIKNDPGKDLVVFQGYLKDPSEVLAYTPFTEEAFKAGLKTEPITIAADEPAPNKEEVTPGPELEVTTDTKPEEIISEALAVAQMDFKETLGKLTADELKAHLDGSNIMAEAGAKHVDQLATELLAERQANHLNVVFGNIPENSAEHPYYSAVMENVNRDPQTYALDVQAAIQREKLSTTLFVENDSSTTITKEGYKKITGQEFKGDTEKVSIEQLYIGMVRNKTSIDDKLFENLSDAGLKIPDNIKQIGHFKSFSRSDFIEADGDFSENLLSYELKDEADIPPPIVAQDSPASAKNEYEYKRLDFTKHYEYLTGYGNGLTQTAGPFMTNVNSVPTAARPYSTKMMSQDDVEFALEYIVGDANNGLPESVRGFLDDFGFQSYDPTGLMLTSMANIGLLSTDVIPGYDSNKGAREAFDNFYIDATATIEFKDNSIIITGSDGEVIMDLGSLANNPDESGNRPFDTAVANYNKRKGVDISYENGVGKTENVSIYGLVNSGFLSYDEAPIYDLYERLELDFEGILDSKDNQVALIQEMTRVSIERASRLPKGKESEMAYSIERSLARGAYAMAVAENNNIADGIDPQDYINSLELKAEAQTVATGIIAAKRQAEQDGLIDPANGSFTKEENYVAWSNEVDKVLTANNTMEEYQTLAKKGQQEAEDQRQEEIAKEKEKSLFDKIFEAKDFGSAIAALFAALFDAFKGSFSIGAEDIDVAEKYEQHVPATIQSLQEAGDQDLLGGVSDASKQFNAKVESIAREVAGEAKTPKEFEDLLKKKLPKALEDLTVEVYSAPGKKLIGEDDGKVVTGTLTVSPDNIKMDQIVTNLAPKFEEYKEKYQTYREQQVAARSINTEYSSTDQRQDIELLDNSLTYHDLHASQSRVMIAMQNATKGLQGNANGKITFSSLERSIRNHKDYSGLDKLVFEAAYRSVSQNESLTTGEIVQVVRNVQSVEKQFDRAEDKNPQPLGDNGKKRYFLDQYLLPPEMITAANIMSGALKPEELSGDDAIAYSNAMSENLFQDLKTKDLVDTPKRKGNGGKLLTAGSTYAGLYMGGIPGAAIGFVGSLFGRKVAKAAKNHEEKSGDLSDYSDVILSENGTLNRALKKAKHTGNDQRANNRYESNPQEQVALEEIANFDKIAQRTMNPDDYDKIKDKLADLNDHIRKMGDQLDGRGSVKTKKIAGKIENMVEADDVAGEPLTKDNNIAFQKLKSSLQL